MKKFLLLIVLCVMALPSFARSGEITEVPMQQTSGDDRTEFGPPVVTYSSDDDELTISFEADDLYILEIKDAAGVTQYLSPVVTNGNEYSYLVNLAPQSLYTITISSIDTSFSGILDTEE